MVLVEFNSLFSTSWEIGLAIVGCPDVNVGRTGFLLLFNLFKAEKAFGEERSILLGFRDLFQEGRRCSRTRVDETIAIVVIRAVNALRSNCYIF